MNYPDDLYKKIKYTVNYQEMATDNLINTDDAENADLLSSVFPASS